MQRHKLDVSHRKLEEQEESEKNKDDHCYVMNPSTDIN